MHRVLNSLCLLGLAIVYLFEGIVRFFLPRSWFYKDVAGETVLITGGGSGIGRLLALKLANLGAIVVLLDIDKEGNENTRDTIKKSGGTAYSFVCDVSKKEEVYATARSVKETVGSITMLVNNAGIVSGQELLKIPDKRIEATFNVNAISHFWTVRAFLPEMKADNHGHIVSIASVAGKMGCHRLTDYCASKFAAVGFMDALSLELRHEGFSGIHTTTVCPYFINTGLFDGFNPGILEGLTPEYVTDHIVSAILTNQYLVVIPKLLYLIEVFNSLLPRKAVCALNDIIGGSEFMDTFTGRKEAEIIEEVKY